MMAFKTIKTGDEDLDRVQENILHAFNEIPGAAASKFVTTSDKQYRVVGDETCVFVDAHAGPVTVVLPTVDAGGEAPLLKRIDKSAQAVTVQAVDRKTIDGAASVALASLASLRLLFDGRVWWTVA